MHRTQQSRQTEPSVKAPERRRGNINLSKSNPQPVAFTVTLCAPAPRQASKK